MMRALYLIGVYLILGVPVWLALLLLAFSSPRWSVVNIGNLLLAVVWTGLHVSDGRVSR